MSEYSKAADSKRLGYSHKKRYLRMKLRVRGERRNCKKWTLQDCTITADSARYRLTTVCTQQQPAVIQY